MQFESPTTQGDPVEWSDINGALLILDVIEVTQEINTVHGPADAVRANVYVVEGTRAGAEYNDALIFPRMLKSQLRGKVGKKVLGRLTQGEAKRGQSPPWMLEAARAGDADKATEHLARRATSQFTDADVI